MSDFKVGDRVTVIGEGIGTVVEGQPDHPNERNISNLDVRIKFDKYWKYTEDFPYNWRDKKNVRHLTKPEKIL